MARNGSGTYTLPAGNPVVTGSTISSTWANNTLNDIGTALTGSIAKDGQTTPTANLPMGGFAHTNVANATVRAMYATTGQVQDGSATYLTSVSGTNTITATLSFGMSAYATGQMFNFVSAGANTGACTLNINSIGAKSIVKTDGSALVASDIASGGAVQVIYDGTNFQLLNDPNGKNETFTTITATQGDITTLNSTTINNSGNLQFTGTANRITGDFTNATLASRVAFQTSTANSTSVVGVLPSGTGTVSSFNLFGNSSTTANAPYTVLSQTGGKTRLEAGRIGSGTYGDMEFWANGAKRLYLQASDNGVYTTAGLNVAEGTSTIAAIEIGGTRGAAGDSYIDFHAATTGDYDFRIIRTTGANGNAQLTNAGTGYIDVIASTNGVRLTNGATAWASLSDETQKDIIEPITNGVDKVATLRSVIGKYKTEDNARRSFLIAQDVQKVLPEAVVEVDGVLNLAYTDVIPLLVSAINELSARVKELEAK
jgi:hypothetical protein